MQHIFVMVLAMLASASAFGQNAVLIEDGSHQTTERISEEEFASFDDVYALHAKKRVAIGASFLGPAGFIGANADIHYLEDNSARVTLGGGPGYQSFGIAWRWMPMETALHPILGVGFTNWFGTMSGNNTKPSPPAFFTDDVITSGDRESGRFSHFFYVPTVGMEWTQLSGPGAGASIFVEINLLIHAASVRQYPTANLGVSYAF